MTCSWISAGTHAIRTRLALRRPAQPAPVQPLRPPRAAMGLALLALCAAGPAAAEWSQIAYIPANQVNVFYDRASLTTDHGLTRAWYMFSYSKPMSSAEGFVFKSYKQLEVIDCKQRGTFTATFTAFSDADGGGRTIYVWNTANAVMPPLNPAVPGSVRALMVDAACMPPPKPLRLPPVPPAPASVVAAAQAANKEAGSGKVMQPGSPMPADMMPTNTQSSPMGTPGQTTSTPLK